MHICIYVCTCVLVIIYTCIYFLPAPRVPSEASRKSFNPRPQTCDMIYMIYMIYMNIRKCMYIHMYMRMYTCMCI